MKNKQGFSAVVLIIILAILAGGAYAVWKNKAVAPAPTPPADTNIEPIDTNVDTSNWKTYRNDEYGFEVKYPSQLLQEFDYYNHAVDPGLIFGLSLKSTIPYGSDPGRLTQPFTVTVTQDSKNKLIQQLMKKSPDFTDPRLEMITLPSGLPGEQITRRYIYSAEDRDLEERYGFEITTLLTNQDYIYSVGLVNHLISTKEIEIYKQILSTFRFTK